MEAVQDCDNEVKKSLEKRMREFEAAAEGVARLNPKLPVIVRVDGKKFSAYTRVFKKPYDERLTCIMKAVCVDLINEFGPRTVYSQSDEISLIFYVADNVVPELLYSGRTLKLSSLIASYAAARFNHHATSQINYHDKVVNDRLVSGSAYFDGRAFNLPEHEVLNYIVWRSHHDARRNSVANYARFVFGLTKIQNKGTREMRQMLTGAGKPWEDLPMEHRLGFFAKKVLYSAEAENPKTGEKIKCMRGRAEIITREIYKHSDADCNWLLLKSLAD